MTEVEAIRRIVFLKRRLEHTIGPYSEISCPYMRDVAAQELRRQLRATESGWQRMRRRRRAGQRFAIRSATVLRATSALTVKGIDRDKREIRGWATTPQPDRMQDEVDPYGCTFALPLPLLMAHDHRAPIGKVLAATASDAGIMVRARVAKVAEQPLGAELDRAWQLISSGLVSGLSIGFRAHEAERLASGGLRYVKSEILEISAVTIPANASCTILPAA